jgi:hypothetical protein
VGRPIRLFSHGWFRGTTAASHPGHLSLTVPSFVREITAEVDARLLPKRIVTTDFRRAEYLQRQGTRLLRKHVAATGFCRAEFLFRADQQRSTAWSQCEAFATRQFPLFGRCSRRPNT